MGESVDEVRCKENENENEKIEDDTARARPESVRRDVIAPAPFLTSFLGLTFPLALDEPTWCVGQHN